FHSSYSFYIPIIIKITHIQLKKQKKTAKNHFLTAFCTLISFFMYILFTFIYRFILRYLSPVSVAMHNTLLPEPKRLATSIAANTAAPPDNPVKIPSSAGNLLK